MRAGQDSNAAAQGAKQHLIDPEICIPVQHLRITLSYRSYQP